MLDILNNVALADAAGPIKDLADKLSGRNGRRELHYLKRFLRKENPWESSLIPLDKIEVPAGAFDPREFRTRKDRLSMWVSDEFTSRILSVAVAKPKSNQPAITISIFDLVGNMGDSEIRRELPANHLIEPGHLWRLIKQQSRTAKSAQIRGGNCHVICYMEGVDSEVFAVYAGWCWNWFENHGTWNVHAWKLNDDAYRDQDYRVLSRN